MKWRGRRTSSNIEDRRGAGGGGGGGLGHFRRMRGGRRVRMPGGRGNQHLVRAVGRGDNILPPKVGETLSELIAEKEAGEAQTKKTSTG